MPHDEATIARAKSFESGAEAYDEFRPGYPDELFDDLMAYAACPPESRVLDIGAGTGKATIPLARRGLRVTAVEPAETMARLLWSRADEACVSDRVHVRVATFEDLGAADGPFGLIVAAQSFHWTDPGSRWSRVLELLAPSAAVALFWNTWYLDPVAHDPDLVRRSYGSSAPDLIPDLPTYGHHPWPADEIEATADLVDLQKRSYAWSLQLSTPEYLALLSTTSQYAVAPEHLRAGLFEELRSILGERVHLNGTTQLHVTRRTPPVGVPGR
ncbi:MAG TPA: methyltransferase domain-containing protein [Marmoricola sp.]|nr:methyltransferase domain-containing protein [Marmoricola sp.]